MSEQQHDFPTIDLKPIISYPRQAESGQTYLMSIDVQFASPDASWPYPEEEYPIFFLLDTYPYFNHESLDERKPAVVLHRFGGTYGPVKYLLTATREAVEPGYIHITLINGGGLPIGHMELECEVTSKAATAQPRKTTAVRRTTHKRKQEQFTPQIAATPLPASAETIARNTVEKMLIQAGWVIQDSTAMNIGVAQGIAMRESPLSPGWTGTDYLLVIHGEAIGVIEHKEGTNFSRFAQSIEDQLWQYQNAQPAIPSSIRFQRRPLPFAYGVVGSEIRFTNYLEPDARTRHVFHFHQPETLALWLSQAPIGTPNDLNDLLRSRLRRMPPLEKENLRHNQYEAILRLEESLAANRPRALIQMATGSGKTYTMVNSAYRLLRYGGARRILILVDRKLLAYQTLEALRQFIVEDTEQPFRNIYNTQFLENNRLNSATSVCVTTIQHLHALLTNESLSTEREAESFEEDRATKRVKAVNYDPILPVELFDVIFVDECHRGIYSQWRPILEFFDAFLIGLTATPDARAFAFFNRNLIYEYSQEQAIADGIILDYRVYRIHTEITERGSSIEQGSMIWERDEKGFKDATWLTDDLIYDARVLDRDIVAIDQIRTIIRAFNDALFTELFPGRTNVPKTVIFAKDERHAEDIVQIVKEEFDQGNEFVKKITSRATGAKPEQLIQQFRNNYYPRIAVAVSMLLGLDIQPLEIVIPMRSVRSRILQHEMIQLGCRAISDQDLQAVTPQAHKDYCIIVDPVGMTENITVTNTPSVEKKQKTSLKDLLDIVADREDYQDAENILLSLSFELNHLSSKLTSSEMQKIEEITGRTIKVLSRELEEASDSGNWLSGVDIETLNFQSIDASGLEMMEAACEPFKNQALRNILLRAWRRKTPQIIDDISSDRVISAGFEESLEVASTSESTERKLLPETIHQRFSTWLANQQQIRPQPFTDEQILWLERIRDRISNAGTFTEQDFERSPFAFDGGLVAAHHLFGSELPVLLQELKRALNREE